MDRLGFPVPGARGHVVRALGDGVGNRDPLDVRLTNEVVHRAMAHAAGAENEDLHHS
jgi:hypothetical protein